MNAAAAPDLAPHARYPGLKRAFDLCLAVFAAPFLAFPLALIAMAIKLTSPGPVLYWSKRVGRGNHIFLMPKFRTMRTDTPQVATHLMAQPERYLTPLGPFLRRTSLDELPQILSIMTGHLSFVGPRPALFNQDNLVALRNRYGIQYLTPGLTGWAQVNGRDELPIPVKVEYDREYLQRQSFLFDLRILWLTFRKVLLGEGVQH